MKIKFDFGTKSIPHEIIGYAMSDIVNAIYNKHRLHTGKCTIYMSFYDEDGLEQIPCTSDRRELNYLIRAKQYTKVPKNTEYVGKCSKNPEAHLYMQFND